MKPTAIIDELHAANIMIELRGGVLRCRPKPTGCLLELIRANRVALATTIVSNITTESTLYQMVREPLDRADELDRAGDEGCVTFRL